MQHIRVRMLAMSLNNVLSGQPLNSWSLGQVWNEAHTAALQTYCLHSAQQNFSVPDTHIHNRCRYHCSCCGCCLKGEPRLCFSKEEDEEDPGCPGYGANTEGGLPWGLSFSLLFQGVWWLFLHPILVPTMYPQGTWSTLSFVSLAPATGNLKWKCWLTSSRTLAISALPTAPAASSHNPVIWEQWILI